MRVLAAMRRGNMGTSAWHRGMATWARDGFVLVAAGACVLLSGCTSIHEAAYKGDIAAVQSHVSKGNDVNAKNRDGQTALIIASWRGQGAIARLLVDKGADVNAKDGKGHTALMLASERGYLELARLLVDRGADVNAKDERGRTALRQAAASGYDNNTERLRDWPSGGRYLEITQLLLDHGADLHAEDRTGSTPLHLAAESGSVDIVRLLVDKGADIRAKDEGGRTALMTVSVRNAPRYFEITQFLVDKGAEVNLKSTTGGTALMRASASGSIEAVRLLIDRGADVNAIADDGWTAWMSAIGSMFRPQLPSKNPNIPPRNQDPGSVEIANLLRSKISGYSSNNAVLFLPDPLSCQALDGKGRILFHGIHNPQIIKLSPGMHSLVISIPPSYEHAGSSYKATKAGPILLHVNATSGGMYYVAFEIEEWQWRARIEQYK